MVPDNPPEGEVRVAVTVVLLRSSPVLPFCTNRLLCRIPAFYLQQLKLPQWYGHNLKTTRDVGISTGFVGANSVESHGEVSPDHCRLQVAENSWKDDTGKHKASV